MERNGKPILLMQMGDTPPFIRARAGNFDAMFFNNTGLERKTTWCIRQWTGENPEAPATYRAVVVSGSHDMVTDRHEWSERAAEWLLVALDEEVPVLGVCFGHQLLAQALGGEVGDLPGGPEIGSGEIVLTEVGGSDPFAQELPATFPANLSHSQTVLKLPAGAKVLAASSRDSHQLVRYGERCLSVQFHPEFNETVIRAYLDYFAETAPALAALKQEIKPTPAAAGVVERFLRLYA